MADLVDRATTERRGRPWRSIVFAPVGDGVIRRRGSDVLRVVVAVVVVVCSLLVADTNSHVELALVHFLTPPPNGVAWLVTWVWWLGSIGVIVVLAIAGLLTGRREVARDLALSGLGAWGIAALIVLVAGSSGGRPPTASLGQVDLAFPVARIAATTAVITAVLPYLSRACQRLLEVALVLVALDTVVHGSGTPTAVVAAVAVGWGATAVVRLVFGSPLGLPAVSEVADLLAELGITASVLRVDTDQVWGVARYHGAEPSGGRLDVSVYGRDAHDAQLLAKLCRFVFYRDSGPTLALTRVQQVEHEAYLTLMAARAGATASEVLAAGSAGPSHDAVLVTRPPEGRLLVELEGDTASCSDAACDDLFRQLQILRAARLAHGAVSVNTVMVGSDWAGLVDFRLSSIAATTDRLDRDMAGAMAALAVVVGPTRAAASAVRALDPQVLAAALVHLQRAALGPSSARSLRGKRSVLTELRTTAAKSIGIEPPKLVEPRRLSWVNLVMVVGTLVGGWALIGVLVDVTHSFSTIAGASIGWVVAVFLLSQSAYLASAVTVVGSITDPLPYGRAVALEVANTFVSLAGGSMGALATRVRFFQQEGYDTTLAVSSGVVVSTASWIVKGVLFLIALPIAFGNFHFKSRPTGSHGGHQDLAFLILTIVVLAGFAVGALLVIPRLRRLARDKLRPKISDVWSHLRVLSSHPRNLFSIFGGSVVAQLVIALALGAALHAFDRHLGLATLLVVLTLASMIGGISPVPGGMGVVEGGMIVCLQAAGIPQDLAVAATFVQRLFTSYLPPIWGWFVLMWMRRREYL